QGKRDADHVVMVALDAGDERSTQAVDGEAAGDREWFPGGDVGVDLAIGQVGEVDDRRRGPGCRTSAADLGHAVPGVEDTGAATHPLPALTSDVRGAGLAEHLAVEFQHRVAAEHQGTIVTVLE